MHEKFQQSVRPSVLLSNDNITKPLAMRVKEIAKNQYYEISVDLLRNRMYLKIIGFWKSAELVPNYVNDIETAGQLLKPKFTLLTDLREMDTPPLAINRIHENAQTRLMGTGLGQTAEVFSDIIMKSVTRRIADNSHMRKSEFTTVEEAEQWLDLIAA